jgi:hypothetical protein
MWTSSPSYKRKFCHRLLYLKLQSSCISLCSLIYLFAILPSLQGDLLERAITAHGIYKSTSAMVPLPAYIFCANSSHHQYKTQFSIPHVEIPRNKTASVIFNQVKTNRLAQFAMSDLVKFP